MAKDTTSQHVWRILMICLALGAGALLLVIGYTLGARLAAGPQTPQTTVQTPVPQQPSTQVPGAAQKIGGAVYENGGVPEDRLNVTWLAAQEQKTIALPFVIPGVVIEGARQTADVTQATTVATARDARGNTWEVIRADVPEYSDFGGAAEGVFTSLYFLHAPSGTGNWQLLRQATTLVRSQDSGLAPWLTGGDAVSALGVALAPQAADDAAQQVNAWLAAKKIQWSNAWMPEFATAHAIADEQGNNLLVKKTEYVTQGDLFAAFQELPVVATLADGSELRSWMRTDLAAGADAADVQKANGYITANTYYHVSAQGLVTVYYQELPVLQEQQGAGAGPVTILGMDGAALAESAMYTTALYGGCGVVADVTLRQLESSAVQQIGTANGQPVYGAKDPQSSSDYQTAYKQWSDWQKSRAAYDGTTADVSWATFLKLQPIFYWQNALGQWLMFSSSAVAPIAECGKPVLYLYPEQTTDLKVQLYLQGGFTKSVPAYGEKGWSVTAAPDGTLLNHADGQQYPYLFWEGFGSPYQKSEYYDVVAKDDVPMYLINTLWQYGLNQNEMRDFMEFWLPRMQQARYYKVSWISTEAFNQLAPLSISQKPDTLIRILMEYEPLAEPVESKPMPTGERPERNGFTVVEWGGVLKTEGGKQSHVE